MFNKNGCLILRYLFSWDQQGSCLFAWGWSVGPSIFLANNNPTETMKNTNQNPIKWMFGTYLTLMEPWTFHQFRSNIYIFFQFGQGVELAKRIDDRVKEATLLLEAAGPVCIDGNILGSDRFFEDFRMPKLRTVFSRRLVSSWTSWRWRSDPTPKLVVLVHEFAAEAVRTVSNIFTRLRASSGTSNIGAARPMSWKSCCESRSRWGTAWDSWMLLDAVGVTRSSSISGDLAGCRWHSWWMATRFQQKITDLSDCFLQNHVIIWNMLKLVPNSSSCAFLGVPFSTMPMTRRARPTIDVVAMPRCHGLSWLRHMWVSYAAVLAGSVISISVFHDISWLKHQIHSYEIVMAVEPKTLGPLDPNWNLFSQARCLREAARMFFQVHRPVFPWPLWIAGFSQAGYEQDADARGQEAGFENAELWWNSKTNFLHRQFLVCEPRVCKRGGFLIFFFRFFQGLGLIPRDPRSKWRSPNHAAAGRGACWLRRCRPLGTVFFFFWELPTDSVCLNFFWGFGWFLDPKAGKCSGKCSPCFFFFYDVAVSRCEVRRGVQTAEEALQLFKTIEDIDDRISTVQRYNWWGEPAGSEGAIRWLVHPGPGRKLKIWWNDIKSIGSYWI